MYGASYPSFQSQYPNLAVQFPQSDGFSFPIVIFYHIYARIHQNKAIISEIARIEQQSQSIMQETNTMEETYS